MGVFAPVMKITVAGLGCVGSAAVRLADAGHDAPGADVDALRVPPAKSSAEARPAMRSPKFGLRSNSGKPSAA